MMAPAPSAAHDQECFDRAVNVFVAGVTTGQPFATDLLDNLETMRLMKSGDRAAGVEIGA